MKLLSALCFSLATTVAWDAAAADQDAPRYPTKAVTVVVPWSAGQATDVATRTVTNRLAATLGQPFVVDNRPGAGGSIGSAYVAKASPDVYTLLAGSTGSVTINPILMKSPYNAKSFAPVGVVATVPYVLVTSARFPAMNLQELMIKLKAEPGKYSFASSGNGSIGHLVSELFLSRTELKAMHVPYKGSGGALPDVLAGRVDFMFDSISSVMPHVKAGKLRAYAISSNKRSAVMPNVPSVMEAARLKEFDLYAWIGLLAPAGSPEAVLERLNLALNAAVNTPDVTERLRGLGIEPATLSRSAMARLMDDEKTKLGAVINEANIKLEPN